MPCFCFMECSWQPPRCQDLYMAHLWLFHGSSDTYIADSSSNNHEVIENACFQADHWLCNTIISTEPSSCGREGQIYRLILPFWGTSSVWGNRPIQQRPARSPFFERHKRCWPWRKGAIFSSGVGFVAWRAACVKGKCWVQGEGSCFSTYFEAL